jgi:hypothetical protein
MQNLEATIGVMPFGKLAQLLTHASETYRYIRHVDRDKKAMPTPQHHVLCGIGPDDLHTLHRLRIHAIHVFLHQYCVYLAIATATIQSRYSPCLAGKVRLLESKPAA